MKNLTKSMDLQTKKSKKFIYLTFFVFYFEKFFSCGKIKVGEDMKIVIANDHRGVELKNKIVDDLVKKGYTIDNVGTDTEKPVDYPVYAKRLSKHLEEEDFGILICGTGIGMSIAANKIKGIRCAKASNIYEAKMTRMDNDANVLAVSSAMDFNDVEAIIMAFLTTEVSNEERHIHRRKMIEELENER